MIATQTCEMPAIYLPRIAKEMGILPVRTICECSVGPLNESIATGFKGHCDRLLLIEPMPFYALEAERVLGTKVLQVAVGMNPGRVTMINRGVSSFIKGTWAPTPGDGNEITVEVVTFDTLDDNQIDIFNLDCEGQEWAVLSKMKSRPKLLNVEIYPANPYVGVIFEWLKGNNYTQVCYTGPANETQLYVRND